MRELFLRFMQRCRLSCDKKKWRIGVVKGKTIAIFKLETWCLIRSFHINIEGNVYIFCIFRSLWHALYLREECFVKKIRIINFFFLMFPYFSVFFSIHMLIELTEMFVCICNQIFYSHSNSPVERSLFIVICWLSDKVHIGGGVTVSIWLCEFFALLILESAPSCPYFPRVCLPADCFVYNKNIYCVSVFVLCTSDVWWILHMISIFMANEMYVNFVMYVYQLCFRSLKCLWRRNKNFVQTE